MKYAIMIAFLIPLFAVGCTQKQKRLKVTYDSDPPGGGLYKQNGQFWGPCPKTLWYDLDNDARGKGYLEAKGLIVRWPSGPQKRSDRLVRIPVDGTDQQVTFVQSEGATDAPHIPNPVAEPTEANFRPDPELPEEKDDETVWIRRRTKTVDSEENAKKQRNAKIVEVNATTKIVEFGNVVSIEFALIPASESATDSASNDKGTDSSGSPAHTTGMNKPFYMSVYEVTQEQYERVMNANPSRFPGQMRPVDTVSWKDAQEFCRKLSSMEGGKCNLPTEEQWEYACRAGSSTAYYWGDDFDDRYAWIITNSDFATHDVGTRLPNAWGLHDMAGNVWEWCQNSYGQRNPNSAGQPENSSPYRVLRGGSWGHSPKHCESAHRNWHTPNHRYDDCGFRIVLEAE